MQLLTVLIIFSVCYGVVDIILIKDCRKWLRGIESYDKSLTVNTSNFPPKRGGWKR